MIEPSEEVKEVERRYEKALDNMEKHYKDVFIKLWNEIEELQQDILKSSETPLDSAYNINIGISMALGIIRKYMKEYTK